MTHIDWTKFYWHRYWNETPEFKSASQHGIYLCLRGAVMMFGPLRPESLQAYARCTPEEWEKYGKHILSAFFKLHRGKYVHQESLDERQSALNRMAAKKYGDDARASGRLGNSKPKRKPRATKTAEPDFFLHDDSEFHEAMADAAQPDTDDDIGGFQDEPDTDEAPAPTKPHINGVETKTAIEMYNETAIKVGLPKAQLISETRKKKLKLRLEECGGLDGWRTALDKIAEIPGLQGNNDRGWRADLDFLLQAKSFTKLMEGGYDHWKGIKPKPTEAEDAAAVSRAIRARKLARERLDT